MDSSSPVDTFATRLSAQPLSAERKAEVLDFLATSRLINKGSPVVGLQQADLQEADLREFDLDGVSLGDNGSGEGANLAKADLRMALLNNADLRTAHLEGAHLEFAFLTGADLTSATLGPSSELINMLGRPVGSVQEGADLSAADLTYAN